VREETEHQAVLPDGVRVELTAALHPGVALRDAFGVAAQTEGVDVEAVSEEGEGA